jgi:hypothetical protein
MKIHRILCLGAAIVLPQMALAKLPFSNDAFGRIEGTLDFCAQANPQAAQKYQEGKKQMVHDVPEKEVAEARKTQEYKDAYQWISGELAKQPQDKAVQACSAYLEGDK